MATSKRARRRVSTNGSDPVKHEPAGIKRVSDVKEEKIHWLWTGWIARGKVNIIEGDPGLGKSTVTFDVAARVTVGRKMPTGSARVEPSDVLMITAEDGMADTVKPRLRAAGADQTRALYMQLREDDTGEALPFSVPEDMGRLTDAIEHYRPALVIIDPVAAFFSEKIQSHNDASVRRALSPLMQLAEHTGTAILLVRHLNKSGGGKAIYRGGGSIAIGAASRSEMLVAKDPNDPSRRVLAQVKGNISRGVPPSVSYKVTSWSEDEDIAVIEWGGEVALTADELVAGPDGRKEAPQRNEAEAWIKQVLADGPMPSDEFSHAAGVQGISERTLKRARAGLVKTEPVRLNGKLLYWRVGLHAQPTPESE